MREPAKPQSRPAVLRLIRELATAVVADYADKQLVRPVITVMLETSVRDFYRYYDARHAAYRLADHDIWMAMKKAAKTKTEGG